MHYKLTISERAESHIDNILDYVVNVLKNPGAARAIIVDMNRHIVGWRIWQNLSYIVMTVILPAGDIARSCFRVTIILFCTA